MQFLPPTLTQLAPAQTAPTVATLRQLLDATLAAHDTYRAACQRAFGPSWRAWLAPAHTPNLHPHRAALTVLRQEWEAAHRAYTAACRAFHLPRAEG